MAEDLVEEIRVLSWKWGLKSLRFLHVCIMSGGGIQGIVYRGRIVLIGGCLRLPKRAFLFLLPVPRGTVMLCKPLAIV